MKIHSMAISGLLTLGLHSLNNEGAEGNYMQTRQVQLVDEEGHIEAVNAISGDMFKHIQAEHLYHLAVERGLPLCGPCKTFDANRIVADEEFSASFDANAPDSEVLSAALRRCVVDDLEGVLITNKAKKWSIARKSVVEFGWVVGRPASTRTDSFFHVKYDPKERGKGSGDETGSNTGQNIFHRPASSGQYAVVLNLDLYRIGRNDILMQSVITREERVNRHRALLQSVLYTFLQPRGAMRNTQNPHVVEFSGVVATSSSTVPAPLISALNARYGEEIESIAGTLNRLNPGSVALSRFSSLAEFAGIMERLITEGEPVEAS